jgi:hypothetical protein
LFLLLLVQLVVRLALQTRLLLGRLLDWLEEALQPTLLRRLHVLGQFLRAVADPVFAEVLLFDEVFDEALDVGRFPLEVAFWGVGGAHIGLKEEEARVGEGPVVGNGEFLLAGLEMLDYAFKVLVVTDQLDGGRRADALDGVKVVAAEEDAEVDELASLVVMTNT